MDGNITEKSGETFTLRFDNKSMPMIGRQFHYGATNKFTSFLEPPPEYKGKVLITMTCVQIPMNIREEYPSASADRGQMMRLFDVHVKDINDFNTQEKVDKLKVDISRHLGLALKEDAPKTTVAPEGPVPQPVDRLRQVIYDSQKCKL